MNYKSEKNRRTEKITVFTFHNPSKMTKAILLIIGLIISIWSIIKLLDSTRVFISFLIDHKNEIYILLGHI
jgi:uncharacterized membrane protein YqjE